MFKGAWCRQWPVWVMGVAAGHAWGCATCGCTLSADAAMGFAATSGWRLSFEYDYINQDQLRSGTAASGAAQVVDYPSDPSLHGGEIEHDTLNRYLTVGVDYSPTANWDLDLRLPYVLRAHSTYGVQTQPYDVAETAPDQLSNARVSGMGDAKFVVSYQGWLPTHNLGLQVGVKLPSGSYGSAVTFNDGPGAGSPLDASLQAGTGSTDLIVGGYYYRAVSQDFDAFVNTQFQAAVLHEQRQPGNDFRPGNSVTLSAGLRYEAHPAWVPQLQFNLYHKSADQGALADRPDTAGTVLYASPGITLRLLRNLHVYGFVQVPVASNLDGYQLFPHWTVSAGVSYAL